MRIFFSIAFTFLTIGFSGQAQTWSMQGGVLGAWYVKQYSVSVVDNGTYTRSSREANLPLVGGYLGGAVEVDVSSKVSFRTGLNFTYTGTRLNTYGSVDYNDIDYWYTSYSFITLRTYAVGIPLLLKVPVNLGESKPYFLFGGELNANITGSYHRDWVYLAEHVQYTEEQRQRGIGFGRDYDRDMCRYYAATSAGFGLSYDRFYYELLFTYGLTSIINKNANGYDTFTELYKKDYRPVYLGLTMGYKFKRKD